MSRGAGESCAASIHPLLPPEPIAVTGSPTNGVLGRVDQIAPLALRWMMPCSRPCVPASGPPVSHPLAPYPIDALTLASLVPGVQCTPSVLVTVALRPPERVPPAAIHFPLP